MDARDKDFLCELLLDVTIDAPGDAKTVAARLFRHGTSEEGHSQRVAVIRLSWRDVEVICSVRGGELGVAAGRLVLSGGVEGQQLCVRRPERRGRQWLGATTGKDSS